MLRDQFKAFDTDGSGTLTLNEFRAAMIKNARMDPQSIEDLFAKVCELQSTCPCCRIVWRRLLKCVL